MHIRYNLLFHDQHSNTVPLSSQSDSTKNLSHHDTLILYLLSPSGPFLREQTHTDVSKTETTLFTRPQIPRVIIKVFQTQEETHTSASSPSLAFCFISLPSLRLEQTGIFPSLSQTRSPQPTHLPPLCNFLSVPPCLQV